MLIYLTYLNSLPSALKVNILPLCPFASLHVLFFFLFFGKRYSVILMLSTRWIIIHFFKPDISPAFLQSIRMANKCKESDYNVLY